MRIKKVISVFFMVSVLAAPFFRLEAVAAEKKTLVALGDSLTAGYGLQAGQGFTDKLQAALLASGMDIEVMNAGVSGDTAQQGLERLDWAVSEETDAVLVELGANNALRGLPVADMEAALDEILKKLTERKIPVLLAGMQAPPNMGKDYAEAFNAVFPRLAAKHKVKLYPFFLDGVAGNIALNQADGIHPNAEGVDIIVKKILPQIHQLLMQH